MSEFDAVPNYIFTTRTNSELGAESVEVAEDGSIVFRGVLKKVTEAMLQSYPRTALGKWTPNRLAIRFDRDEVADRQARKVDSKDLLSADDLAALAS